MASKHSTFSSLSWKDVLENNDRRTLEKNYAFSRFGPFCKINKVFPQTIFAAVRVPLNYLLWRNIGILGQKELTNLSTFSKSIFVSHTQKI
jgi:hypothetical protein